MSISGSNLTSGQSAVAGTTFTSATITPLPNTLVTVAIVADLNSGNGPQPISTITGCSGTWANVTSKGFASVVGSGTRETIEVWRTMTGSPTTDVLTITYSSSVNSATWTVSQFSGVSTVGNNGAGAIGITATNASAGPAASPATVTLSPFGSTGNGTYAAVGGLGTTTFSAGAGLSLLGLQNNGPSLIDEWAAGNVSPATATYVSTAQWGVIGLELITAPIYMLARLG